MPSSPLVARPPNPVFLVTKDGAHQQAQILRRDAGGVYVHYLNTDKRMDEWIPESDFRPIEEGASEGSGRKRKRQSRSSSVSTSHQLSAGPSGQTPDIVGNGSAEEVIMTEEDYDIQHHKQITAQRNFDKVNFGRWQIKTWYFSPYPLTEAEVEDMAGLSQGVSATTATTTQASRIPGVNRATVRSHGRTSDLLAGGLGRSHGLGEKSILWVCDRCFKYMADGVTAELHGRKCTRESPPGKKVYQRGAHTIWEVDGAKDKLYCQNLSLFGKLFIDVKTLFFDCDNFLFYLLTEGDTKRDHVLGFFSKEKLSYDDYNLACIITLPPYQKKGFGMLMIEFSYELSRRAGKVGTPERPLSDLGLRGYLTYWISTLIRFLRRLLSVVPSDSARITSVGAGMPDFRSPSREYEDGGVLNKPKMKRVKGWYGEIAVGPSSPMDDPVFTSLRTIETTANEDGGATSHVVVRCTLRDIARATNLRVEDAAFALGECGLLTKNRREEHKPESGTGGRENEREGVALEDDGERDVVVISREMVEAVAKERGVKKMMMDLVHVLL